MVKKSKSLTLLLMARDTGLFVYKAGMFPADTPKDAKGYKLREMWTGKVVAGHQYELTIQQAMDFCAAYIAEQVTLEPKARAMALSHGFDLKPVRSSGFRVVDKALKMNIYGSPVRGYQPVAIIEYLADWAKLSSGDDGIDDDDDRDGSPDKSPPLAPAPAYDPHFNRFMKTITESV